MGTGVYMDKLLLGLLLLTGCASHSGRVPAQSDPTYELSKQLSQEDDQSSSPKYCRGNPPGSDDAWCSWVCIDGKWSRICR